MLHQKSLLFTRSRYFCVRFQSLICIPTCNCAQTVYSYRKQSVWRQTSPTVASRYELDQSTLTNWWDVFTIHNAWKKILGQVAHECTHWSCKQDAYYDVTIMRTDGPTLSPCVSICLSCVLRAGLICTWLKLTRRLTRRSANDRPGFHG